MIIRKKTLYISSLSILFTLFIITCIMGYLCKTETKECFYQPYDEYYMAYPVDTIPDLPLPVPSLITTEVDNIRLDLEKISANKFFIVYSVIYGNQSHTAYHLYLTDLNRKNLDKNAVGTINLKTSSGEIISPVAQEPIIEDFPIDQPLGWKIKIIVKFPYQVQRQNHQLILVYKNKEYILSDIYY